MKKTLLASAIAILATSHAYADYQFELGAVYTQGEAANTDYDGFGIAGEFHFDKVDTSKGPLAEASFLDKSSFVNFNFLSIEPDFANADEIETTNIGGRFVTATKLIIEADWTTVDTGNSDADSIRVGVGTYLNDNTDVVVSYTTEDDDNADVDYLDVAFHGVNPLNQGASVAYDVAVGYIDTDNDSGYQIAVGGTYYFNTMFGIGVNAGITDVGDASSDTISIDASFFPNPQIELYASIFDSSIEENNNDADADGILLGAAVRF
ncbi:MAG: putative porin [Zhongshania sp.]|uniref:putative porin n=1 Tax=Zhongshania sp. TaxID=1971902 RepID=UPI0026091F20|nr:putative porin [Zhongshania sp.]MDF1690727.1 putative porin [Zhongshania sp.]